MRREAAASLWSSTKKITGALLALWLAVNLLGPWFARDLDALTGNGPSIGFWVGAEGALVLYLAIIVVYAVVMDRLERRYLREQQRSAQARATVAK